LLTGKYSKVKLGLDPKRPDLPFGHMAVFNKLRQFQNFSYETILLIGDYATIIGESSSHSEIRLVLSKEQIGYNSGNCHDPTFTALDPEMTAFRRNSERLREISSEDALNLARRTMVARMLARNDFSERYSEIVPISIGWIPLSAATGTIFLYPLPQVAVTRCLICLSVQRCRRASDKASNA
jgi:tyrosyl-tRNA synthetase